MAVDGVNQVRQDGRYKLPAEIAERYEGEFVACSEQEHGKILLTVVDGDE